MKGPALLLTAIILFSLLDANSKLLSGSYGVGQVIFLRFAVLVALFLALRRLRPGLAGPLRTTRPGLHALRAVAMMISAGGFFLAFRQLPLAEGYLVFFTAPFLTLALSALALKEVVPAKAWLWCAVGFGGVLLSLLPKLGATAAPLGGYLALALATAAYAISQTVNRSLRGEQGLAMLILWPGLLGLLVFGPLAAMAWQPPPLADAARLGVNGLIAGTAVALAAAAYGHADAARLAPFSFVALPASVALDYGVWGHPPDAATLLGGLIVTIACLLSERARRATAQPAAPPALRKVVQH